MLKDKKGFPGNTMRLRKNQNVWVCANILTTVLFPFCNPVLRARINLSLNRKGQNEIKKEAALGLPLTSNKDSCVSSLVLRSSMC